MKVTGKSSSMVLPGGVAEMVLVRPIIILMATEEARHPTKTTTITQVARSKG